MKQGFVKGSSVLVTGANGGIGKETVKQLIKGGAKRIVLACRRMDKAEEVVNEMNSSILEPYGGFDMLSPDSIREAVETLPADQKFDIVFLQSGGMVVSSVFQFKQTGSGQIERTVFQNTIGGYLVITELVKRDLLNPGCRIVFAGGEGARGIPGMIKKPSFKRKEELLKYITDGNETYNALNAIGVSKFMSALLVQKLAEVDSGREYIWFSPGLTGGTRGLDRVKNPKRFVMKNIMFPLLTLIGFAQNKRKAAKKNFDCLDGVYGTTGEILGAPEGKALGRIVDQKPMNAALTNRNLIDGFWDLVQELKPFKSEAKPMEKAS